MRNSKKPCKKIESEKKEEPFGYVPDFIIRNYRHPLKGLSD